MGDPVGQLEQGLAQVAQTYEAAFASAGDEHALREENAKIVGPQGTLTALMKLMRDVPAERRREFGKRANRLKHDVTQRFEQALKQLFAAARQAELSGPALDVTLPGRGARAGRLHAISRVRYELLDVFRALGFDVADGPEIDLHENCFDKLGFPPDHPATDMQDTFYVHTDQPIERQAQRPLLRTHTSTIQVRTMEQTQPPLAIVAPGAVYRRDDDATHSPMFFQIEGLLVDEGVSFADLKGVLTLFIQRTFGEDVPVRFRPSYFPFVEPGGEVDMGCTFCRPWAGGERSGCSPCKSSGWIEILGCGMVHPVVFEHVGYDPERYTGFAFGLGIDRIAMIKYGVPNIKLLYENDIRFLSSF